MKKAIIFFVILLIFSQNIVLSQRATNKAQYKISGAITDSITNEPMFGVNVMLYEKAEVEKYMKETSAVNYDNIVVVYGAATDFNGIYSLNVAGGTYILRCHDINYEDIIDEIEVSSTLVLDYKMNDKTQVLGEVVVSAGRYEQKIAEVTVSMELMKAEQLENKNTYNLTSALTKLPGVDVNDHQVSIRSSSGWSYGAGSRVIVLMDELPIMSADAGDVKWSFIPMENIEQVEVIKGAASALFGSSALGGVINLRSSYPKAKPETNLTYFVGIFGKPQDDRWKWWGNSFFDDTENRNPVEIIGRKQIFYFIRPPMYSGLSFNHKQQFGNFDLVLGGNNLVDEGYRLMDFNKNTRFNVNTRYRFKKIEGLAVGFNSNFMSHYNSDFFNWASDTTPFINSGYIDKDGNQVGTLMSNPNQGFYFNIDPFVYYYSPKKGGGRYSLRTRYWLTANTVPGDTARNSRGDNYYAEFQYHNTFNKIWTVSAGFVESFAKISSNLLENHISNNLAFYGQLDAKFFSRLNASFGFRLEHFRLDKEQTESLIQLKDRTIPIKPVFRAGLNYMIDEITYLRASIGQGYRFPAISEKYISLNFGNAAAIYPNPDAKAENGWNAEIGIKRGFIIKGSWRAFADVSVYHQRIYDMLEFSFGIFDSETKQEIPLIKDSINANIENLRMGFITRNVDEVMITGVDISSGIVGKMNKTILTGTLSYTYNYPIHKGGEDKTASTTSSILKYRFKHSAKADIQIDSRRIIAGFAIEWKSAVKNVDRIFCDERDATQLTTEEDEVLNLFSNEILSPILIPGFVNYRLANANKNYVNIDVNFGFKFNHNIKTVFLVRNLLNQAFSGRPADICAPRRYEMMITVKF